MVGFDNGTEHHRELDGLPVANINANLTGDLNLSAAEPLKENLGVGFRGNQKGGPFDVTAELAYQMIAAPMNANGSHNNDVVRPWANGLDITRRPRDMWLVDFGVDMSLEDAALYELPFEYVQRRVYPIRAAANRGQEEDRWWIHERPRPAMRSAIAPLARYAVTNHVSKHRLVVWLEGHVIPDHQLIVFALDDDYSFGVLHSRAHELWALRMGTSLEDRPRYTPTTCFETFPFPEPTEDRASISEAARRLDELRRNWLDPEGASEADLKKRTLTNLYNARPTWLDNAHKKLDAAVFAAYGWPADVSDEDILKNLLALNLERSAEGTAQRPGGAT